MRKLANGRNFLVVAILVMAVLVLTLHHGGSRRDAQIAPSQIDAAQTAPNQTDATQTPPAKGTANSLLAAKTEKTEKTMKVCVFGQDPPYNQLTASGEIVGFDVDMGHALLKKMGYHYQPVTVDWDGIIPALLAKKCDAIISSMAVTDERKKRVNFTDAYYPAPPVRFASVAGRFKNDDPATLQGITAGVQRATVNEEYLRQKYPAIRLHPYASQTEANIDLINGRVDVTFADVVVIEEFLKTPEAKAAKITLFGKPHHDEKLLGLGAGIAVRKEDEALRQEFNRAIKAVRASGEYQQLRRKYFDF